MKEIKLKKSTQDFIRAFVTPQTIITQWMEAEAIKSMMNFFSNPSVVSTSITNSGFMTDGFCERLPIVQAFVFDAFDDEFLDYVRGSVAPGMIPSFAEAKTAFSHWKADAATKKNKNPQIPSINPVSWEPLGNSSPNPLLVVMRWDDIFRSVVVPRIIAACQWILDNMCDTAMINNDLPKRKFPEVIRFFYLNDAAAELFKFCFIFRATRIKMPRSVKNYEDRLLQLAEMTGLSLDAVKAFTKEHAGKKFLPFILENIQPSAPVWNFMASESTQDIEDYFYHTLDTKDALPLSFFNQLDKENTATIQKLLDGPTRVERPRHILLYGKPGTGKTSYVKSLAKLTGKRAYIIPQMNTSRSSDDDNGMAIANDTVSSRFDAIRICGSKVDPTHSVIVVDEADEMINCQTDWFMMSSGNHYSTKMKSMLNQIMDESRVPVIWITNNSNAAIDPSCRRRFDYSVYFDNFTEAQREIIWNNTVQLYKLRKLIPTSLVKDLAAKYAVTPGGISIACRALIDIAPEKKDVATTLTALLNKHCELLGIETGDSKDKRFKPCKEYSLEGLNITSSIKIDEVTAMCKKYLEKKDKGDVRRSMSILFSGVSGAGKTECVKYIGSVLKKNVRVVRGSTVLNKYVGETEKNIAKAFREAEQNDEILFMDEIDGLLSGREKAHASWEVSQVNEILQQMENYRGIFIGASNFEENLDSASVRRFTFKFKFDYLTGEGILSFYNRYFGDVKLSDDLRSKISDLRCVTPGDFATVKMLSEYTPDTVTPEWIYESLKRELAAKKSNNASINAKPKNMGY